MTTQQISPEHIMQIGMGFEASKTLLSAVELGVFTELAKAPADGTALRERLGLHPRGARDFFDTEHPPPVLRVVRGNPDAEELAALAGVLMALTRQPAPPAGRDRLFDYTPPGSWSSGPIPHT